MSIVLFIAVIVVLIVVHEFGHFSIAKLFGIRVDEFGVGYPPRAYTLWKRKGTTYTLNWLPFGGFVRIFGERFSDEYSESEKKEAFVYKPKWQQALVLIAGVVFNLLFAWILFSLVLFVGAPTAVSEQVAHEGVPTRLVINAVTPRSPAEAVGLVAGDQIIRISTKKATLTNLVPSAIAQFIQKNAGTDMVIQYIRRGSQKPTNTIAFSAAQGVLVNDPGVPAIGIAMTLVATQPMSALHAVVKGFTQTIQVFKTTLVGFGTFLSAVVTGTANWNSVAGPIGIAGMVGNAASIGFIYLLYFTAFISVNLAVINLLPLPALDGGRLLFIGIEMVLRRPIRDKTATIVNVLGFAAIIILMIIITYHDILKLF